MKFLIPAACVAALAGAAAAAPTAAPQAGANAATRRVIPLRDPSEVPRRCPVALRGVDLELRLIPGGVALEFTSLRRRQVPELREQLREAALALAQYSKTALRVIDVADAADGATGGPPSGARLPPLDVSVRDVGTGARVLVRAQRAGDLPELLELARTFEVLWSSSDCSEDVFARARAQLPSERA